MCEMNFDMVNVRGLIEDVIDKREMLDGLIDKHKSLSQPVRDQVFISYSHKDKRWLDKLQTMLKPLTRSDQISVWTDRQIKSGSKWREEIEKALRTAKVAVFLVSPSFLASDFIVDHELHPLLDAAERDDLTVLWVAVSPSMYEETDIAAYQAAHDPSKPLNSMRGAALDRTLVEICGKIKSAANS